MTDRTRSGRSDEPSRREGWRALVAFLGVMTFVFLYAVLVSMNGLAVSLVASLLCTLVLAAQLWRSGDRAHPPVGPARSQSWTAAKRRFAELQRSYAGYECDPMAVLRLPALADVTVPSTARFIDALAEAQALDCDHQPPAAHRVAYIAAVDHAHRAWAAARAAADRIRLADVTPAEKSTVDFRLPRPAQSAPETNARAQLPT